MGLSDPAAWNFDIDRYLNPLIPSPPWRWVPYPIAYFLGHKKQAPKAVGNVIITLWAFVGIFAGLLVVEAVSAHIPVFEHRHGPIVIASFGAAAVLNFHAIESPLAQPRNTILGQIIASIVGVGICKLFLLSPHFESIRWIGGALACAAATAIMALTKTVHPPAGSTALLAVVTDEVIPLGWWMVPMALLGAVLMVSVALIFNNIQRTFPVYWWTPEDLTRHKPSDVESKLTPMTSSSTQGTDHGSSELLILIRPGQVIVPDQVYMTEEEKTYLEELSGRLR